MILVVSCEKQTISQKQQIQEAVHSMFEDGSNRGEITSFDETIADSVLIHYAGSPSTLARDEMSQFNCSLAGGISGSEDGT